MDSYPLMTPGTAPVALPANVDLTPAPRDPAQAGSRFPAHHVRQVMDAITIDGAGKDYEGTPCAR